MPDILLFLCGVYNLALLAFHAAFWQLFRWHKQLRKLKYYNRAIVSILNLRLMYVFGVFAALCFGFPEELLSTSLGRFLLGSMAVFWLGRLIEQLIFLRVNVRLVHVLTALLFLGTVLHVLPLVLSALVWTR
ncbi:hypothetical protein [Hymenobacter sp. CRA2]|uniref:hypothetical protein n=1 Tax=Hymenobacter sp. CRA2 TaxID=1955620 RepID=UPI0009D2BB5C|nr:hypothetical protein [Hymenobacter sp. CRA2]OON69394.1 hypothetical protein B0919_08930 [Hymenobacter sp. CRA2]